MAAIFLVYAVAIAFLGFGLRKTALTIALINLLFILAMFWHHVTDVLHISL